MLFDIVKAIFLGIVEGLTEFIPVSSTGHLLLVEKFITGGEKGFWDTFSILIQLGAILALLSIYFTRLWGVAMALPSDPAARRFVIGVLVAFLPAVVMGVIAGPFIKSVLFNPWIVCTTLILGGFVLLWIDRLNLEPTHDNAMRFPLPMYLGIGVAQCLAMIPGVSRSGATIVAAMLFGADRRSAAEFSFYLAMPTMVGAFAYEAYKSKAALSGDQYFIVAVGFAVSFIAGWIVVKSFLDYVSRHGFALFAWWRIIVGALGLIALGLFR